MFYTFIHWPIQSFEPNNARLMKTWVNSNEKKKKKLILVLQTKLQLLTQLSYVVDYY